MLLALLLVLRGDLADRWQRQLPPEKVELFHIILLPELVAPLKAFWPEHRR